MTLYELLKSMEADLRTAYKLGGRIPCGLFRDLEIYEEYIKTDFMPKMGRYTFISEKFKITETSVRLIIKKLENRINNDNLAPNENPNQPQENP